jgi:hypothetical protein
MLTGIITTLAACAASPQAGATPTNSATLPVSIQPSAAPTALPDARLAGIQDTLDQYSQAYRERDRALLTRTIDPANASLISVLVDRFQTTMQTTSATAAPVSYQAEDVTSREHGFVQVRVRQQDGQVADWLFHQVGQQWLLAEPTARQLGERQQIETAHFTFYTYSWAQAINPTIMDLMEQARAQVLQTLGTVPDKKARVYIRPIAGIAPMQGTTGTAMYDPNVRSKDLIAISAPASFSFPFYDPAEGWQPALKRVLAHEYTHFVNDNSSIPLARMSNWMVEGLAEYVAEPERMAHLRDLVQQRGVIPIIDPSTKGQKHDLEHLDLLGADRGLGYGLSYSLVVFIVERYGGLDGFWKLVKAFDTTQDLDAALQQAFGISYPQFDRDWRAWLAAPPPTHQP